MKFIYQGTDHLKQPISGAINAISKNQAQELLEQQGIHINNIDIDEQSSIINKLNIFNYPTKSDLIIFAKQMHSLLRAGVPIIRSINIVGDSCKNQKLSTTLTNIGNRLEAGYSFESAMNKYPKIFPKLFRALVNIGEQTGTLANIFERIAGYLYKENEIKKGIKTAMRYPILVICSLVIAMIVINVFIIPSFTNFFKDFKAKLPLPTRVLIFVSNVTLKYWWLILIIIGIGIALIIQFINTEHGRYLWDKYKVKLPIFGSIIERSLLSGFARSFALCFKTGIPVLDAFNLIGSTCNNAYMEKKILEIKTYIEHGESMTIAAKNSKLFNGLVLQMILIGEESGEIDRLFDEVALFYDEELDYDIKQLSSLIEPLLIGVMSIMVIILALGIFLPMWSLAQTTSGM